ncbi:MAG: RimK family alpha-L-glutamate ligase [Clostridia bacterium]
MKGLLVTNGFVVWDKFEKIYEMLSESFAKHDCKLIRKNNIDLMLPINEPMPQADFVLFWDKDITLAKRLEKRGLRLFNCVRALESCDDKSLTAVEMELSGIKMPKTIVAPKTFLPYNDYGFLKIIQRELEYPFVLKECFGSFGNQVWLIEDYEMLINRVRQISPRPMLFQEYIKSSCGRDIRVQVVGNKIVAAVKRVAKEGDFRANVTNGGKMYPYSLTDKQAEMALKACEILGVDFAGVDILFGENEEPVLCEINTNAHFKNLYDATGINTADFIAEYIISEVSNNKR